MNFDFSRPALLSDKNFTPLERTPWAGKMLAQGIKRDRIGDIEKRVGETWEFSTDRSFPSKASQQNQSFQLSELLQDERATGLTNLEFHLLLKLINASSPLSLQVHPSDQDKNLKPSECGKPESWLVLEAKPGAGIYLGFSQRMTKEKLEELLLSHSFTEEMLQFVPVHKGDFFEIEPGFMHVVGKDVVILEPQRIVPSKSGKTFRLWDWNRRYAPTGEQSASGEARELHVKEALALINPEQDYGLAFVNRARRKPVKEVSQKNVDYHSYPPNSYCHVHWVEMQYPDCVVQIAQKNGYGCLTLLAGEISINSFEGDAMIFKSGESAFLPKGCFPAKIRVLSSKASWTYVSSPATSELSVL